MTATPSKRPTARTSTIGLKIVMAVTGLVFAAYVLAHMYGNLKLLVGQDAFNTYAEHLRTLGEPMLPRSGALWVIRVVLLVSVVAHVYAALTLWGRARGARTQRYAVKKTVAQSFSSRWMRWGGIALLLFIVWHLIEFTMPKVNVTGGPIPAHDPYALVVDSFQVWWLTLIYVAAMLALYLHLAHGVFSAAQTLGWTGNRAAYRRAQVAGHLVAALVVVGFLIPPLAILFGAVG